MKRYTSVMSERFSCGMGTAKLIDNLPQLIWASFLSNFLVELGCSGVGLARLSLGRFRYVKHCHVDWLVGWLIDCSPCSNYKHSITRNLRVLGMAGRTLLEGCHKWVKVIFILILILIPKIWQTLQDCLGSHCAKTQHVRGCGGGGWRWVLACTTYTATRFAGVKHEQVKQLKRNKNVNYCLPLCS